MKYRSSAIALPILTAVVLVLPVVALGATDQQVNAIANINIASIVMNGLVRMAAIAAGVYIVWMGHNTMILGVKGEFQFEGQFVKLKGSIPGLLFVLLGTAAIGWALSSVAEGGLEISAGPQAPVTNSDPSPGSVPPPRASDNPPEFMNREGTK